MDKNSKTENLLQQSLLKEEENLYQLSLLNQITRNEKGSCPNDNIIAAYYDSFLAGSDRAADEKEKIKKPGKKELLHIENCPYCLSALQLISKATNPELGFALSQKKYQREKVLDTERKILPVPQNLLNYVESSLNSDIKNAKSEEDVFSMVIRLTKDSMNIIHNSLFPSELMQLSGVALRGTSNEFPSLSVEQKVNDGNISYQIFRENEDKVMLTVKLDQVLLDKYFHVKLRKDDRIISSHSLHSNSLANFTRLSKGNYKLELSGNRNNMMIKMALV